MKRMVFQAGDIIHQKRDQWVFLITKVSPNKVELEYWNPSVKTIRKVEIKRKELRSYFLEGSENAQYLEHFRAR